MNGKLLNEVLNIKAKHALYREDGAWYHHLKDFPGVLFDRNGYLLFNSQSDYLNHPSLQHAQDLHIVNGIAALKEYVAFSEEDRQKIVLSDIKSIDEESIRIIRQVGVIIRNSSLVKKIKRIYDNTCQICETKLQIGKNIHYSEVHHIKPLGGTHKGLDKLGNMMCVCPNCHIQLDLGGIKLDIKAFKSLRHNLDIEYILYYNKKIYQFNHE